jgi:glutamate/tyrosine decarboxylase-like PLP-dependent enzyme
MFSRLIEQNVRQAGYCAKLIEAHPDLELLAPATLNIVCFRFASKVAPSSELNRINEEILLRVQESGIAVPSSTRIGDAFALRVAITNHRSKLEDFDLLVKTVAEIGRTIVAEPRR